MPKERLLEIYIYVNVVEWGPASGASGPPPVTGSGTTLGS
jgi:hypothetical protein